MNKIFLILLVCVLPVAHAQVDAPPAYPREGAVKVLENEHVIVWDISWLKQDYPIHRHRYDHTGVYYSPGDRLITSLEGEAREVHTPAWNISFQLAGVTHTESGISDSPLRAIFIQIKRPVAGTTVSDTSVSRFPNDAPQERLANDRVRVWEYNNTLADSANPVNATRQEHYHNNDAVVVWFDADTKPNVHFVPRASLHNNDVPSAAVRTFVFELL